MLVSGSQPGHQLQSEELSCGLPGTIHAWPDLAKVSDCKLGLATQLDNEDGCGLSGEPRAQSDLTGLLDCDLYLASLLHDRAH